MLAAECAPLAKVGGLADVVGALPKALANLGVDIRIALPFYGSIDKKLYKCKIIKNSIKISAGDAFSLCLTYLPGTKIPVYLIKHKYFAKKEIYQGGLKDLKRFAFFNQAALISAQAINFKPNIIHANDWHTAKTAELLKNNILENFFKNTKTLFTIHNLASQGPTDKSGKSPMAQGILNSNLINTVSPTYAREILTRTYGQGLGKILIKRKKDLFGILNGIDTDIFNPATDNLIKHKFSINSLPDKIKNKLALQKKLNLKQDKNIPLIGMITRLYKQKGINLVIKILPALLKQSCQFVILGTGQKNYEQNLKHLAKIYPKQTSAQIKFDEQLAHQIYAGSDIFLMPSLFEPCGLGQMIAMRYGTVPIVHATGGLADTVTPLQKGGREILPPDKGGLRGVSATGFTFKKHRTTELIKTLNQALHIYYQNPRLWHQLQINGMKKDSSWNNSARKYLKLYKKLAKINIA